MIRDRDSLDTTLAGAKRRLVKSDFRLHMCTYVPTLPLRCEALSMQNINLECIELRRVYGIEKNRVALNFKQSKSDFRGLRCSC